MSKKKKNTSKSTPKSDKKEIIGIPISWWDSRYYPCIAPDGSEIYLPSVTTILGAVSKGDFLEKWRGDIGNREADLRMNEAGDRGSRVHHACFNVVHGGCAVFYPPWNKDLPKADQEMIAELEKKHKGMIAYLPTQEEVVAVWRFKEWWKTLSPLMIGGDLKVASFEYGYAGALDYAIYLKKGVYRPKPGFIIQAEVDGTYIVDVKSGMKSNSHRMQVAAYAKAYEELNQQEVAGGLIFYSNGKKAGGVETAETVFISKPQIKSEFDDFLSVLKIWQREHKNDAPVKFKFPSIITM